MLVLTRRLGESIMIGDNIKVTVVDIDDKTVKLGVELPRDVSIFREEVYHRIKDMHNKSTNSITEDLKKAARIFKAASNGRAEKGKA